MFTTADWTGCEQTPHAASGSVIEMKELLSCIVQNYHTNECRDFLCRILIGYTFEMGQEGQLDISIGI